jgi:hypothetical protein
METSEHEMYAQENRDLPRHYVRDPRGFVRLRTDLRKIFAAPQQPFLRDFCEKHSETIVLLHLKILHEPYYILSILYDALEGFMDTSRTPDSLLPVPTNLRVVLEMEDETEGGSGGAVGYQRCSNTLCTLYMSECDCRASTAALFEKHRDGL